MCNVNLMPDVLFLLLKVLKIYHKAYLLFHVWNKVHDIIYYFQENELRRMTRQCFQIINLRRRGFKYLIVTIWRLSFDSWVNGSTARKLCIAGAYLR